MTQYILEGGYISVICQNESRVFYKIVVVYLWKIYMFFQYVMKVFMAEMQFRTVYLVHCILDQFLERNIEVWGEKNIFHRGYR
jgi:hypothetical protein